VPGWERETVNVGFMLYLVYAVRGVNSCSRHGDIGRDYLTSCSSVIRGDGGNHHKKLGIQRISCASQLTIPDTAGTSPNPSGNNTDRRSSKPNQASHTPDLSSLLKRIPHRSPSRPQL